LHCNIIATSPNIALGRSSDTATSPNIAHAQKTTWMIDPIVTLLCTDQHKSPSNINIGCHEILSSRFDPKIRELLPPLERRFEDDLSIFPSMSSSSRTRPFAELSRPISDAFCFEKYNTSRSNAHLMLRLPWKMRLQLSTSIAPAWESYIPTSLQLHQIY